MKKIVLFLLSVIVILGLVGCAQPVNQPVGATVAQSDKPRETAPSISPTVTDELVSGNSAFAFHLYQVLKDKEGNLFYSPYSISEALAMTYGGSPRRN